MSGVFGIVDSKKRSLASQLQRMAGRLCLQEWHHAQTWADENAGVGLGQAHIGLFASETQPWHSDDGQIAVVFFGELYYTGSLRRQLDSEGYGSQNGSDAELVLRLYQARGERFIHDLEGVFVLAIWDGRQQRLLVANDRFGLIPTYYAHYDGILTFAPGVKGILADATLETPLDLTALAQFMRFQRLLGDRTFFQGLRLLPYGSLIRFDRSNNSLEVAHYWDFDQIPTWPSDATFQDAVAETGRLLRQAVEARTQGAEQVGVYLSGGLDSRTLAGFASQKRSPIVTLTYGVPHCRDAHYAARIARRIGSHHHFLPLTNGRWVRDEAAFHLEATEGFITWTHSHAAPTLRPARDLMDVNLSGFGGDQVLGGRALYYAPLLRTAPDDMAFDCQFFSYLNQSFSWPGITEAEEHCLYTPTINSQIAGQAWHSLREEIERLRRFPYDQLADIFMTIHQGIRLSNLNVVYQRAFFEARYPFYDYQLVDWVYSMPMDFRLGDRLYLAVLNREIPEVTWVPRDTDELLLTDRQTIRQAHGLWQKVRRRLAGQQRSIIHEDPEGWLRRDLRDWAETLLFDPRTLERGIFEPAFLRSIFERHMSGKELHTIGKIAPIMTYEMMLRRFFDGPEESGR
ncbi:MAG: asparagine synthetase B family protein [Chloroflexota bacterium]